MTVEGQKKACGACGEIKPFSDYRIHHRFKDGRDRHCKKCYNAFATQKRKKRVVGQVPDQLTCTRCLETLDIENFGKRQGGRFGRQAWCYDCFNEYNKDFRREKLRESISLVEKECGNCKKTLPTARFTITLRSDDKLYMFCRDCEAVQRKRARKLRGRVCTLCGMAKHTIDFGVNKSYKDGRDRRCLTCLAARAQIYNKYRSTDNGITRQCRVCEFVKPITDFVKHLQYRDGTGTICLDCYSFQRRRKRAEKNGFELPAFKFCTKCDKNKSSAHFHLDRNQPDGLRRWCRECVNENDRERYAVVHGLKKACSKCAKVLPHSSFYLRDKSSTSVRAVCKDCSRRAAVSEPEPDPEPELVHPLNGPRPLCPKCENAFVRFDRFERCWQCRKCSMRFL